MVFLISSGSSDMRVRNSLSTMLGYLLQLLYDNIVTVCLVVAVYVCVSWLLRRPTNLPPGPWAIPFVGSPAVFVGNQEEVFPNLRRKYGDVFTFYAGSQPFVVVGGLEAHKEALVKLGYATSDRPSNFITDQVSERKGLLSSQGEFWKEQRSFTVSKLRQFGMGKVSLESRVLEEVKELMDYLDSCGGQPVDPKRRITTSVANVILSVVFRKRFQHDDPKLVGYMAAIDENFRLLTPFVNIFPWLLYLPGDPFKFKTMMKNVNRVHEFAMGLIEEHKTDFHPEIIRDFTDAYLAEIRLTETDPKSSFSEDQLKHLVGDLSVAGTDTTALTILWGILYLTYYPETQRKLQNEIDSVVGGERHASIMDRPALPYTEATLMEIQRITNIGLFTVPHSTSEEIKLNGYTIPKGTNLMFMLGETLSDPDLWDNPKQFNPDRFLEDGKVVHTDKFFPFSMGRRSCPGEALAKMELFLVFTALMQRFTFKFPDGETVPSTERVIGLTVSPRPYRVRAIPR